jgi:hypothetical protein
MRLRLIKSRITAFKVKKKGYEIRPDRIQAIVEECEDERPSQQPHILVIKTFLLPWINFSSGR